MTKTKNANTEESVNLATGKQVLASRKRTSTEIREEGLTPRKMAKSIQRRLLLANVLTDELKGAWKENGIKGKQLISRTVSGKLLK